MARRIWFWLWVAVLAGILAVLLLQMAVPAVAAATSGWDILALALLVGLAGAGGLYLVTPPPRDEEE